MTWERNMNWENVCLIYVNDGKRLRQSAKLWRKRYKIPADSCFALGDSLEGYLPLTRGVFVDVKYLLRN